jgi:hypothetical protein
MKLLSALALLLAFVSVSPTLFLNRGALNKSLDASPDVSGEPVG